MGVSTQSTWGDVLNNMARACFLGLVILACATTAALADVAGIDYNGGDHLKFAGLTDAGECGNRCCDIAGQFDVTTAPDAWTATADDCYCKTFSNTNPIPCQACTSGKCTGRLTNLG